MAEKMFKSEVPQYDHSYNGLSNLGVGYFLGGETHESQTSGLINGNRVNRPGALRVERAHLLKQYLLEKTKDGRKRLQEEAQKFDLLDCQLMNKNEVSVDFEYYGIQRSSYVELDPNPGSDVNKPTIFLWPGISNDPEGTGWLGIKMAEMKNCRVIIIGYPEGWDGDVTKEFGDAVAQKGLEPHTEYFIEATKLIAKEKGIGKFYLAGVSTGAALVGEAVKNEEFTGLINEAAVIAPAGCVDIKNIKLAKLKEMFSTFFDYLHLPYLSPVNKRRVEMLQEKRDRMLNTFNPLSKKIMTKTEWWIGVKKAGVKMKAIVYRNDHLTESIKVVDELRQQEIEVNIFNGFHSSPVLHPEMVVDNLFKDLK